MTDFQTGIIALMRCAFTGERTKLPEGFSIDEAEIFSAKQHITTLIYDGAVKCGVSPKEPAMQRMFRRYVQLMLRSEGQMAEVEQICKTFDENGIDYLPLKGCNMKKLYPKPELRYMGDADILIRQEQYDRIRPIMLALGLAEGAEYYHEYHWSNANIHMELHKAFVPSTTHDMYAYWGSGWDKAKNSSGTRYVLSHEDDFLFQFTHFAKHYCGPGIGCRYLLDLWVFLRTHPDLDDAYLERELSKLKLLEFYRNIRRLISVWFEGRETDDRMDFMTEFLFSGSSWGNWKNGQVAKAAKNRPTGGQNKVALMLEKLFPPLSRMVFDYPILKKAAFLLPVCWLLRIVHVLLFDPANRKKGMYVLKNVSGDTISDYKIHMQYVGLDIGDAE